MKEGQQIRIVKYGRLKWLRKQENNDLTFLYWEDDKQHWIDEMPELVGKEGTIKDFEVLGGRTRYRLNEIEGYFNEDQLQKL